MSSPKGGGFLKKRLYVRLAQKHFAENRQMLFLMGPRQVGKTTIGQELLDRYQAGVYINWDDYQHQQMILNGGREIAEMAGIGSFHEEKPLIVFDEIHKFSSWKNFLKGFFDIYEKQAHILVTGSSRLDTYRRGGDSLMGRYFVLRVHPLSLRELLTDEIEEGLVAKQNHIDKDRLDNLLRFGGFPEPFVKGSFQFYRKWSALRHSMLFREDIRDLNVIHDFSSMELLAEIIRSQVGGQVTYTSFAKKIRKSVESVRRWISILKSFYYCFDVTPWSENVTRSLLKEPKYYLWDWSLVDDEGFLYENFVASHLLKAVHLWNDYGLGKYGLHYVRDKDKREVDFLLSKEGKPWVLIETKRSEKKAISDSLGYFQEMLNVPHAFQLVLDAAFVNKNCFVEKGPIKVSAKTFLSQLV